MQLPLGPPSKREAFLGSQSGDALLWAETSLQSLQFNQSKSPDAAHSCGPSLEPGKHSSFLSELKRTVGFVGKKSQVDLNLELSLAGDADGGRHTHHPEMCSGPQLSSGSKLHPHGPLSGRAACLGAPHLPPSCWG